MVSSCSPTALRIKLQVPPGPTKCCTCLVPHPYPICLSSLVPLDHSGLFPRITVHGPPLPDLWSSSLLSVLPAWAPVCLDLSLAASLLPVTHTAQVPSPWNGHPANTVLTPLVTLDHSVDGMFIPLHPAWDGSACLLISTSHLVSAFILTGS